MMDFAGRLVSWQRRCGRHDLPWQGSCDPYAVWLAEIMLQQTQVATVIPYYLRFLGRFPDIGSLAGAELDEVLRHWSGLGYYSRARNLHRAACLVQERHGGRFPRDFEHILALPGIGRSTAAAVSVFAFGERRAILDGNVKRVLARCFGIEGFPGKKEVEEALWKKAGQLLPHAEIEAYTQALMDLGATVCTRTRPDCPACPVQRDCAASSQNRVAQLPAPRPRKPLPQKETVMLLLRQQGNILLEKRPPSGIWGGLWSFPEALPGEDVAMLCLARYRLRARPGKPLPQLAHVFTHFRLTITPQPVEVDEAPPGAGESNHRWLSIADALSAAVPAPVRRLLALAEGEQGP